YEREPHTRNAHAARRGPDISVWIVHFSTREDCAVILSASHQNLAIVENCRAGQISRNRHGGTECPEACCRIVHLCGRKRYQSMASDGHDLTIGQKQRLMPAAPRGHVARWAPCPTIRVIKFGAGKDLAAGHQHLAIEEPSGRVTITRVAH